LQRPGRRGGGVYGRGGGRFTSLGTKKKERSGRAVVIAGGGIPAPVEHKRGLS